MRNTAFVREAGTSTTVTAFEYDSEGRIIRQDVLLIEADGVSQNEQQEPIIHEYNDEGTLIKDYMGEYDDKVNFPRTNEVLMFVHRNFSRSNPITRNGL